MKILKVLCSLVALFVRSFDRLLVLFLFLRSFEEDEILPSFVKYELGFAKTYLSGRSGFPNSIIAIPNRSRILNITRTHGIVEKMSGIWTGIYSGHNVSIQVPQ